MNIISSVGIIVFSLAIWVSRGTCDDNCTKMCNDQFPGSEFEPISILDVDSLCKNYKHLHCHYLCENDTTEVPSHENLYHSYNMMCFYFAQEFKDHVLPCFNKHKEKYEKSCGEKEKAVGEVLKKMKAKPMRNDLDKDCNALQSLRDCFVSAYGPYCYYDGDGGERDVTIVQKFAKSRFSILANLFEYHGDQVSEIPGDCLKVIDGDGLPKFTYAPEYYDDTTDPPHNLKADKNNTASGVATASVVPAFVAMAALIIIFD
ncbi:hypothetical protein DdX_04532 [Ditylenchus destructor]|uniref:Uncharacterized protein n=1 Tax=Ditylenchus destructor TaxID=166010 RepID=A0AAD4NB94_9BILA|nr:hypothetical protein DdX_04532 [Ditylenchus destructor]